MKPTAPLRRTKNLFVKTCHQVGLECGFATNALGILPGALGSRRAQAANSVARFALLEKR